MLGVGCDVENSNNWMPLTINFPMTCSKESVTVPSDTYSTISNVVARKFEPAAALISKPTCFMTPSIRILKTRSPSPMFVTSAKWMTTRYMPGDCTGMSYTRGPFLTGDCLADAYRDGSVSSASGTVIGSIEPTHFPLLLW